MKTNNRKLGIIAVIMLLILTISGCTKKSNTESKGVQKEDMPEEEISKDLTPIELIRASIENLKKQSSFHVEMVNEYTPMNEYYSGNKTIRSADYQKDGDSYILTENYKNYMYCNDEQKQGENEKFCIAGENGHESYYYNDHGKRYQIQNGHTTSLENEYEVGGNINEFFPEVTDYKGELESGAKYLNLKIENIKFNVEEKGDTKVITYTYKETMFDKDNPDDKNQTYIEEIKHTFTIENDILIAYHYLNEADSFSGTDQVKINQPRTMESDIKYSNLNNVTVDLKEK